MNTKKELLEGTLGRYLKATKEGKTVILDELAHHTGMNRKSLIRALRRLQMKRPGAGKKPGRRIYYGPDVNVALKEVWIVSNRLCAERLHSHILDYVRPMKRDGMWRHRPETTKRLLEMSMGTVKNRITTFKNKEQKNRNNTTTPSKLQALIPIRRGPWENPEPGYGEIDTVVHCGGQLVGNMAYTVNYTDIATTWWAARAQMNKGERVTRESVEVIEHHLPFPLRGLDPDSGSEFINWHMKEWCDTKDIDLTRSRPYRKNDNAHIEQKNYTTVRNFIGYGRIDTHEQVRIMNKLYEGPLNDYINFFQPSMKCVEKKRVGSRYVRRYDHAKSPFQRVIEHPDIPGEMKASLVKKHSTLNPAILKKEIDRLIKKIVQLRARKM